MDKIASKSFHLISPKTVTETPVVSRIRVIKGGRAIIRYARAGEARH